MTLADAFIAAPDLSDTLDFFSDSATLLLPNGAAYVGKQAIAEEMLWIQGHYELAKISVPEAVGNQARWTFVEYPKLNGSLRGIPPGAPHIRATISARDGRIDELSQTIIGLEQELIAPA